MKSTKWICNTNFNEFKIKEQSGVGGGLIKMKVRTRGNYRLVHLHFLCRFRQRGGGGDLIGSASETNHLINFHLFFSPPSLLPFFSQW